MGGRLWLGLLLLLPLGAAAAAADDGPPPVAAVAAEEPTAVTVVSGDTVELRTTSDLVDTLTGAATAATGTVLLAGDCAESLSADVVAGESHVAVETSSESVGSSCLVTLEWASTALTAPAAGHLVLGVEGLDDAVVGYHVTRTTAFDAFAVILALALVVGVVGALILRGRVQAQNIPADWSFKDAWATSLTGLTAVAAGLFALTGVLDEYAPQYSTAGALAANLVVLVLVGMAPVAFAAARTAGGQPALRRGFVVAGGMSLAAAAGQVALIALVVLSGSTVGWARVVTLILLVGALVGMLFYAAGEARHLKRDGGSAAL
jgi:hypothetical protein